MTVTSSNAATSGYPGLTAYSSAMVAGLALVRCVALALIDRIRVNAVSPGQTATNRQETSRIYDSGRSTVSARDYAAFRARMLGGGKGRTATALEVAHPHLFLVSDEASFITCVDLPSTGRRHRSRRNAVARRRTQARAVLRVLLPVSARAPTTRADTRRPGSESSPTAGVEASFGSTGGGARPSSSPSSGAGARGIIGHHRCLLSGHMVAKRALQASDHARLP